MARDEPSPISSNVATTHCSASTTSSADLAKTHRNTSVAACNSARNRSIIAGSVITFAGSNVRT